MIDSGRETIQGSKNLEEIRYRLLDQFCTLMQLNTHIYNFGKNAELLINMILDTNIGDLKEEVQKKTAHDAVTLKKFLQGNKRHKKTLKLLYEEQDLFWHRSKLCTQEAMLDFNVLAREIKLMLEKLEHSSLHDFLTGLYNRRYFYDLLRYEIARSERHQHPFCLLAIDFNNFKKINDTFGHASGDEVLKQFSDFIKTLFRKNDVVARIGGDEFSVLLIETAPESGVKVAQSLINKINDNIFKDSQGHVFQVSISVGFSAYPRDAETVEALKTHADLAMYEAKKAGKNQVVVYRENH